MSHYTWHNVTENSRITSRYDRSYDAFHLVFLNANTSCDIIIFLMLFIYIYRHTFATLSLISEIFIFLYVGMDALDIEKWRFASKRY